MALTQTTVLTVHRKDPTFSEWFAFSKAHASEVCQRIVSREFIAASKRSSLALLVAFRARPGGPAVTHKMYPQDRRFDKPGLRLLGFAVLRRKTTYRGARSPPHLYVSSVCARGYGTKLLMAAERLARNKGLGWITLAALPHVITYYHNKLGYRFFDRLGPEDMPRRALSAALPDRNSKARDKFLRLLIRQNFAYDQHCRVPRTCDDNGYWMAKRV